MRRLREELEPVVGLWTARCSTVYDKSGLEIPLKMQELYQELAEVVEVGIAE